MRAFIGVELDPPVRSACAAAARRVRQLFRTTGADAAVRWVPDENLHITVAFLGNVVDSTRVAGALGSRWEIAAFPFEVDAAGAFPPSGPLRTLWLGVGRGGERLVEVHRELSARLLQLGYERERRPYHPHITIGRVKDMRPGPSHRLRSIAAGSIEPIPGVVDALTLFESRVSSAGARYTALLRVPLKGC